MVDYSPILDRPVGDPIFFPLKDNNWIKAACRVRIIPGLNINEVYSLVHVLIEEKPRCRTIFYSTARGGTDTDRAYLSFPYVSHVFSLTGCLPRNEWIIRAHRVFFRNEPITSFTDTVYIPPLPNYYNGRICLNYSNSNKASLTKTLEDAVNRFWLSSWYAHGGYELVYESLPKNDERFTLDQWVDLTKRNPQSILSRRWFLESDPDFAKHMKDARSVHKQFGRQLLKFDTVAANLCKAWDRS